MGAVILSYQNKKRNDKNIHHQRRAKIWSLWW